MSSRKRQLDVESKEAGTSYSSDSPFSLDMRKRSHGLLENRLYFNKILGHPARFNVNSFSLEELLELISPVASIHFNFEIDLSWMMSKYPARCNRSPVTIVVGERDVFSVQRDVKQGNFTNVVVYGASLPIPYGSHHTKLSIFESNLGRLHIIISTANLVQGDWENKTQAFYHCSGGFDDKEFVKSSFQEQLTAYLDFYAKSRAWSMVEYWRDRIINANLSEVEAQLICSVPGYHSGNNLHKFGHMRLRKILSNMDLKLELPIYHAQFSSFGSLGPKPESWLLGQFLQSLNGGEKLGQQNLKVIFPCVEDVRNSVEGYLAGGSLCYSKSTAARQPYIVPMLHKWRCEKFGRTRAMPHIKTYAAFNNGEMKPAWLLVTSANLSKAAWGELQKNNSQLGIRSYELGVLVTDDASMDMLPYDMPLTKYSLTDKVWIWDITYKEPDVYGAFWPRT